MNNSTKLSTASAGEAFTYGMPDTSALLNLLARWEARSRDALPVDAMLVNKHIRELREALATSPAPGRAPLTEADLPIHPEVHSFAWTDMEKRAILKWGNSLLGIAPAGGIGGEL